MKDFEYIYDTYFKKFEKIQKDKDFFKSEIYSVVNYIYDEINFSKEHIRINKDGIEVNFNKDIEKFYEHIEKWKKVFIFDKGRIRVPQRVSIIFLTQYHYLTHLKIFEKDINEVFEIIREDLFDVNKKPNLKKAKKELTEQFYKIHIMLNSKAEEYEKLLKENPTLTHKEIVKILDNN